MDKGEKQLKPYFTRVTCRSGKHLQVLDCRATIFLFSHVSSTLLLVPQTLTPNLNPLALSQKPYSKSCIHIATHSRSPQIQN